MPALRLTPDVLGQVSREISLAVATMAAVGFAVPFLGVFGSVPAVARI